MSTFQLKEGQPNHTYNEITQGMPNNFIKKSIENLPIAQLYL